MPVLEAIGSFCDVGETFIIEPPAPIPDGRNPKTIGQLFSLVLAAEAQCEYPDPAMLGMGELVDETARKAGGIQAALNTMNDYLGDTSITIQQ